MAAPAGARDQTMTTLDELEIAALAILRRVQALKARETAQGEQR